LAGNGAGEGRPVAAFELTTSVSNLRQLRGSDLDPYDAVYLGNIHCRHYEGNLLERPDDLRTAVEMVRDQNGGGARAARRAGRAPPAPAARPPPDR
jgi:hypothetical protein